MISKKINKFNTGNAPGSFKDLYTKDESLGRGAFGLVYKVTHKPSQEIWAVKEVPTLGMKPHLKHLDIYAVIYTRYLRVSQQYLSTSV